MSKSLTERVMTVDLKLAYAKGFLCGVVTAIAAPVVGVWTAYIAIQVFKFFGP